MKFGQEAPQQKLVNGNDMKIGAVILSRYSSHRLPGKALININNKPVLQYIIERLQKVLPKDSIVIATSQDTSDDAIATYARLHGTKCYRGSLENVAERFCAAAEKMDWNYAIRINGDNIFADIHVLSAMVDIVKSGKYDFVSNVKGRTFPKGMSIEIVNVSFYRSLLAQIQESEEYREHVTLYLYDHQNVGRFYFHYNDELPEASGIQMALDTAEDLRRTEAIIGKFNGDHTNYNLKEIYTIYKSV